MPRKMLYGLAGLVLVIAVVLGAYFIPPTLVNDETDGGKTLSFLNWGDYIDPDLITKFEAETGVKVIYETFDSNEAMLAKIEQGGSNFDLVVPSDYTISIMKEKNLLAELDYDQLPNAVNLDPSLLHKEFDPQNAYSVPYFWGTVGILYNTTMVDEEITSWSQLWDVKYRNDILLSDSAREVVGLALASMGYSQNTTDEGELAQAQAQLMALKPNVKAFLGDEIKMLMVQNEAPLSLVWSGTAAMAMEENENLDYVIPEEGSNIWYDNMVIPASARNKTEAHQFINFMLEPENAAANAEYVGYSTPNEKALDFLDPEVREDERFYPSEATIETLEVYQYLGVKYTSYYNDIFLETKISS
ncbi:ABC transporter substrate-binding protein [Culicoidibacter larvae]|nr:spermidine/putrescine ABC transporter substrate-binding protein [Culicoidibacter larvae]